MSGWTQDIPAHLSRPREQGVIDAPRVECGHGPSSWQSTGKNGRVGYALKAGSTRLPIELPVKVPEGLVIQCAPAAPIGPLAAIKLEPLAVESFAAEWQRLRGAK